MLFNVKYLHFSRIYSWFVYSKAFLSYSPTSIVCNMRMHHFIVQRESSKNRTNKTMQPWYSFTNLPIFIFLVNKLSFYIVLRRDLNNFLSLVVRDFLSFYQWVNIFYKKSIVNNESFSSHQVISKFVKKYLSHAKFLFIKLLY